MRLIDVRKYAIRHQVRVRFPFGNGMQCLIDEHGISRVPDLKAVPDFNLEDEFGRALEFTVELAESVRGKTEVRKMDREGLQQAVGTGGAGGGEHEEE